MMIFFQPWSEVKRNMWKSALGDEYESPSQCYAANMQQNVTIANDSIATRPSGRHLNFDTPAESEADDNVRMLADFINKGKQGNSETVPYVDLPNTAPPESGLCWRRRYRALNIFSQHIFIFFINFFVVFSV